MNFQKISFFLVLLLILASCSNDSTNDLTETLPANQMVTFSNVKAIMQNNCTSCHGTNPTSGAPNSLVTYEDVKKSILEDNLIERISIENGGSGLMPEGGQRLPQSTIDIVIKWQTDGFQE